MEGVFSVTMSESTVTETNPSFSKICLYMPVFSKSNEYPPAVSVTAVPAHAPLLSRKVTVTPAMPLP